MKNIYTVKYRTGRGRDDQTLYHFVDEAAANDYLELMIQDPAYASSFYVDTIPVFHTLNEALESNPPTCEACGMEGTVVETITDMLVWHHEDPSVEDEHDFEPADRRPQIIRPFIDAGEDDKPYLRADAIAFAFGGDQEEWEE